ncbi:MAG: peptide/nickel transport system substrate-binding protein [Burkholderiaceae bacterium]|jgi:peptide/nickel transport system substrate-binding protein
MNDICLMPRALKFRLRPAVIAAASFSLAMVMAAPVHAQTVTAVLHSSLRVLDPIITTAYMSRNHGYMIFDTLLATDGAGKIQPQMAEKYTVSADGKTYTFTLRPGLKWHDGAAVKSDDCIASITRFLSQDKMGQVTQGLVASMKAIDDKSFQVVLKEPTDLILRTLAKPSGVPPFMMPKRIAETPGGQPIKEQIGSGPFKFLTAEFKPGLKAVYEKNRDYVPRSEPASGNAGGKVVNVDRVEWVTMPDAMTAVNALLNGEIDYIEQMPYDLLPMVEGKKDIKVEILDKSGYQTLMRMNHLYPPFNNKLIRQAAMFAINQDDVMMALIGNPKYYKTCAALFGCGTAYESSAGKDMLIPSNLEMAKKLLKEAKYDGTPVLVMHPTDVGLLAAQPVVIAQALRKAGFVVNLQSMDWQSVVTRRAVQEPVAKGGWNIFSTNFSIIDVMDPLRNPTTAANGKQAWFGWPDVPKIEELRQGFARTSDPVKLKSLADEVQKVAVDEGVVAPMGQYYVTAAYRTSLSGVMAESVPYFWNLKKTGK